MLFPVSCSVEVLTDEQLFRTIKLRRTFLNGVRKGRLEISEGQTLISPLRKLSEPKVGDVRECGMACMKRGDCGAFHFSEKCILAKVSRY